MDRHIANIHAANLNFAIRYIPKAWDQLCNGRFSGPGRPYQCGDFSLSCSKRNIIKDFPPSAS